MAQSGSKRDVDKDAGWDDDEPPRKKHISKVTNFESKEKSKNENENDNNKNENENENENGARMKENDVPDFVASFGNSNEYAGRYGLYNGFGFGFGFGQHYGGHGVSFGTTSQKSNDQILKNVVSLFQGTESKPENITNVQEWKQYVSTKCGENCVSKREELKVCEYGHSLNHSQLIEDGLYDSGVERAKLIGNFDSIDKLKEWVETHKGDFQSGTSTYYVIPSKPFTYVKDELIHEMIVMKDDGLNLIRNPFKKPYPYSKEDENHATLGKKAWLESQKGEIETKQGLNDILKEEYKNMAGGQVTQMHFDMDKVNKLGPNEYMRILSQANKECMNENFGKFLNGQFDGLTRPNIQIWNGNPNNPCHSFDLSALFPGLKSGDSKERCHLLGIGRGASFDTLTEFVKCFGKLMKQNGYIDEKDGQYKEPTTVYVREDTYKPVNGVYDDDEAEQSTKWSKFTVELS